MGKLLDSMSKVEIEIERKRWIEQKQKLLSSIRIFEAMSEIEKYSVIKKSGMTPKEFFSTVKSIVKILSLINPETDYGLEECLKQLTQRFLQMVEDNCPE